MDERRIVRDEWVKFGVLALVLLGAVLAVALARPLVFERILPALLGDFLNEPPPAPVIAPEEPAGRDEAPLSGPMDETVESQPLSAPDTFAEAQPPLEELVHTIQAGENLTVIARNYGVTVEALLTYNDLQNANRITAGDQLRIPRP